MLLLEANTAASVARGTVGTSIDIGEQQQVDLSIELSERLRGGAMEITIILPDGTTQTLVVNEAETLLQIKSRIREIENRFDGGRTEPETPSEKRLFCCACFRKAPADYHKVDGTNAQPNAQLKSKPRQFTMRDLASPTAHTGKWARAQEGNRMSPCGALLRGGARGLLWHVLQPALYFLVFAVFSHELDSLQFALGAAVGVREAVYLLLTVACVFVDPAFLIVSVGASVEDSGGCGEASAYVESGWKCGSGGRMATKKDTK